MFGFFRPKKQQSAPTAPAPQPAPNGAQVSRGNRLTSVVSGLFRVVLSAELFSGVYQLESGSLELFGTQPTNRGRYDDLFDCILTRVVPEQTEKFRALFVRKNLYERFRRGQTSAGGEFCFSMAPPPAESPEAADTETPLKLAWFRVEALALSCTRLGAVRCILFLRPVQNGMDDGRAQLCAKPDAMANTLAWERLRAQKLLGDRGTLFFEYEPGTDTLTLHRAPGNPQRDRVVPHYLGNLSERCDWTVFHEDVQAVRKLLRTGTGSIEIRYRQSGDYTLPFRWHRLQCAPLEDTGVPTLLLGAATDIEDEVRLRRQNRDMVQQIGALIDSTYAQMFEIDTARGTMTRISNNDGVYEREQRPRRLRQEIENDLRNGDIHPDSAADYRNWITPNYLESHVTAQHPLMFEGCHRPPGSAEYHWYAETITCPDPKKMPHRFLRLCRDVTDIRRQRQHNLELQSRVRYEEYNQAMLDTLATLVEFRDVESGQHILRVRELSVILLEELNRHDGNNVMTTEQIHAIGMAATMHDVGKIAIPDAILNKPGRFTPEEFAIMKTHTTRGAQIIDCLKLSQSAEVKEYCRDIALHHHERFDGGGYPEGLVGDANSLAAQVVGLVDAYDALVSVRCYKKAYPHAQAVQMLASGQCGAFGPRLIAALLSTADQLHSHYPDPQPQDPSAGQ